MGVFVTDTLPTQARGVLSEFEVFERSATDEQLAECVALISWPSRAKAELLRKMPRLKVVQTLSAGVDTLDFASLPAGVQVFSNAGGFTDAVAEHAWGLLLGTAKGTQFGNKKTTPRSLRGKTLLVAGCGAIGSEVARLSKSLGMRTIGVSRSFRSAELFDEKLQLSSLGAAIARSDAVVNTLPLTKSTRGVFGYETLSKAKDAVIIVNVGRGETVTEDGLIRWLSERPESRYATDVYWTKDGKEVFATRAWGLPNFTGTHHVSGTPLGEDLTGAKVAAAMNVRLFLNTGTALNRVDVNEYA